MAGRLHCRSGMDAKDWAAYAAEPEIHALVEQFRAEVTERAEEVDPGGDYDWHDLTLGWALAKGLTPDASVKFAQYVTGYTDLA